MKLVKNIFIVLFLGINILAILHSRKFTNFEKGAEKIPKEIKEVSLNDKINAAIFGINHSRAENDRFPSQEYKAIYLSCEKKIECWHIFSKSDTPKGTVILFHGYAGNKSDMIDRSDAFLRKGYHTLLVDFRGSGGSEGTNTTIGYKESEEVKAAYDYVKDAGEKNIILFGNSMGAAAVMKSMKDYKLSVNNIILECPFGSMYKTTCARFRMMGMPSIPFAAFLVFWGGLQNGFWAFDHNPESYASLIEIPTLLLYGAMDNRVSHEETQTIFKNLKGEKKLKVYPKAGHENFLIQYKEEWNQDIDSFLSEHSSRTKIEGSLGS